MARIDPFRRARISGKRQVRWKARLRSAPLLEVVLLDRWSEQVRIFRWRWLAKAAALHHRLGGARSGLITQTSVESYEPGGNVVHLKTPGSS